MTRLSAGSKFRLSNREFFYLQQWMALLIGGACLFMSVWAAIHNHRASPTTHPLHFVETLRPTIGWSLTIAVSLIGTALTRFAFRKPGLNSCDEPSAQGGVSAPKGPAETRPT